MDPEKKSIKQAVFCVCTDEAVNASVDAAVAKRPDAEFFGVFPDYMTAEKRPHFSPPVQEAEARVALIDFERDAPAALRTVARLSQAFGKDIDIVGIGRSQDASVLLQAMRAGCAEFLMQPVTQDDIGAALTRFREALSHEQRRKSSSGRILAFFGAKGGVGATTLAVHLAIVLSVRHKKRVLLIDHKHQLGHVTLYLGLRETRYHFTELVRSAKRLDRKLLEGFVIRHKSGLEVIGSPENAALTQGGTRDDLHRVMDFLRLEYDFILVDSVMGTEEATISLVDQADEINLIATPDVAALRDLSRLIENLALGESGIAKLRLIVNRATANDSISADQIQKTVNFPVSISIDNNYVEIMRAINAGEPAALREDAAFGRQMFKWADATAGVGPEEKQAVERPGGMKTRLRKLMLRHG